MLVQAKNRSHPFYPRIIISSGRSGSTWVQDALAKSNNLPTIYEPFNYKTIRKAKKFAFTYLEAGEPQDDLKSYLDDVIFRRKHRLWCQFRINKNNVWHGMGAIKKPGGCKNQYAKYLDMATKLLRHSPPHSGPILTKCIRANLMAGWLQETYGAHVVILLRHPASVVESQMRLAWNNSYALSRFFASESIVRNILTPAGILQGTIRNREVNLALQWCIETKIALLHAAQYDIPVVYYERLMHEPEQEWRRAADALHLSDVPSLETTSRPSHTASFKRRSDYSPSNALEKWRKRLTPRMKRAMQDFLDRFEIDCYSMASPLPVLSDDIPAGRHRPSFGVSHSLRKS